MKKISFLTIMLILILISCKSNDKQYNENSDTEIIEISQQNNSSIKETGEQTDLQVKLDEAFGKFLKKFEKVKLPYKIEPEATLNYNNISLREQADYLAKAEDLNEQELEQMKDYAKFYYISNPVRSKNFNALVYARSEMGSSYYLLCTFNNKGKLISYIDFAMYQLMGAGPQAGQEFVMTGEIDENLQVVTNADGEIKKYRINEDGKIVKQ